MLNLTGLSLIIGCVIALGISIISSILLLRNRTSYGTELNIYLNVAIIINGGIIYSSFFVFSLLFYTSKEINILFWKISIISGFLSLIIYFILYSFFKEYKKVQIFPFLCLSILFGFLIGILFIPNSIQIYIEYTEPIPFFIGDPSLVNYYFSFYASLIIITFQLLIASYLLYISFIIVFNSKNKAESWPLFINPFIFSLPIAMYIAYILLREPIYRELHIILVWITQLAFDIILIKKPEMFVILPNKIFAVNIYHKSGILLYSYKFAKEAEFQDDSKIWGNILIGLNYILSEFTEKEDKIELIQTRNSDIIVKYENKGGYAVMISTNKKNSIVENLSYKFSEEFGKRYSEELNEIQDLNKIINISEFEDTKSLIEKTFQLYL